MRTTALLLAIALLVAILEHGVQADFYYNRVLPKADELISKDLKCIPGRTVIRIEEKVKPKNGSDEENDDNDNTRRSHMNSGLKEEHCKICVCSVEGKDEQCSGRPARNVNECIRLANIMELFKMNIPYDHERGLSYRIRRVGTNSKTDKCIPFVSEYSDCTEENLCSGCKKCLCVANGEWSCTPVTQCPNDFDLSFVDEYSVDEAINNIESDDGDFDEKFRYVDVDAEIVKIMGRKKRSLNESTEGIKFYHTIDEINEDTLKNDSTFGTLQAKKFSNLSKLSRRTGLLSGDVAANNNSLHIEFNEPKPYDSHITDNKIDTVVQGEDSINNNSEKERINAILGNQTQKYKDKEISKIVVNELKKGTEFIGDKSATIMSNITFTPENDTLTAMAFIAGNLLNQLWNMEKDLSEESKETENLKHEKISDLLELFKEPLNLRQENFLKNALEHLSEAIDKDKVLKNLSLCDKIEETKSILKDLSESSENASDKNNATKCLDTNNENLSRQDSAKQKQATNDAISKINNVLSLITKYQEVHNTLNGLKQVTGDSVKVPKRKSKSKIVLTDDESDSLNVFGKILEKITKLLVPPKKGKKIVKSIRNHNILRKSDVVTNKLKNIYGVDINNSTFSAKDKIVLDYLNTVKQNPHCVLENLKDMNIPFSGIEGDILLNLSQFFKIKSFVDLLKLLEAEKQNVRIDDVTTQLPKVTSSINLSIPTETSSNLSKAKAKLKAHLKSIIDDLNELQEAKGIPAKNFSLADTLPCIYNILNTDKNIQPDLLGNNPSLPVDKISDIFKTLKEELMSPQTRRFGVTIEPRPKSAIVWERIVKNYKGKNTQRTRRIMDYNDAITSFVDLKKKMDLIESTSKTYKSNVILKGLPPNKRLVLLKSLHEEVNRYIDVLEDIKNSFDDLKELSVEQQNDVNDFMYNAANNINLNDRVAKHLNKTKSGNNNREDVEFLDIHSGKKTSDRQIQKLLRMSDVRPSNVRNNMMLSRDDIINQLIRNRMQIYIRAKESKGSDHNNDINYNTAKKILFYLQKGDYNLARELYKYIVNQKKFGDLTRDRSLESYSSNASMKQSKGFKEPLIQFEEPKSQMEWNNHDLWRRRMMNLKKM